MELIVSTLLAAFAYLDGLRTKKQLLAAINSSYVDRLEEAIKDLQTQDQQLLKDLQQELIQKGQLDVAEKINTILIDNLKVSPESFLILKSYINSEQLSKIAMNNNLFPSE